MILMSEIKRLMAEWGNFRRFDSLLMLLPAFPIVADWDYEHYACLRQRTDSGNRAQKALGASQQDILFQFIVEAVILSAAGGIVGTCVGVGGILLVGNFTPLQAGISPVAIALAVSVSGAVGLFFGVVPARQAAKLDPIAALRSA